MDPVTSGDQHAERGLEVFALKGAVESVDEQHDLASIRRADSLAVGPEYVAPPRRQRTLGADAGVFLEQPSQQGAAVAPIGEWGKLRCHRCIARQEADQPIPERKPVFG